MLAIERTLPGFQGWKPCKHGTYSIEFKAAAANLQRVELAACQRPTEADRHALRQLLT
jgi:hypothetical protein